MKKIYNLSSSIDPTTKDHHSQSSSHNSQESTIYKLGIQALSIQQPTNRNLCPKTNQHAIQLRSIQETKVSLNFT